MNWNIEYFVNGLTLEGRDTNRPAGYIILAPYSGCKPPYGYRKEVANSIAEVDALEKKLQRQTELDFEREAEHEYNMLYDRRKEIRERIISRMQGSGVDESIKPYVHDYMEALLQLHPDNPKKQYFENQLECYLAVRHNDVGNRPADKEEVDLDAIHKRIEQHER